MKTFLWIVFICLALVSMYGDHDEIEYLKTGDWKYKREANYIFRIVLIITLLVYLYFFVRNYHAYMNASLSKKICI